jgi:undecaprenyl-diphosphatase
VVPVSSSAQLVLLPWLLGWTPARDRTTFAAGLHAGSCVGIGWALREELRALDRRTLLLVAGASLPAAVVGAVAADAVEQRLGQPPQLAALLAGAGLVMWAVDARAPSDGQQRPGEQAGPSAGGRPPGRAALRSPRWCPGSRVRAPP